VTDDTDDRLAKRAAAGERDAFAELLARHYDRIYRMAWRFCGSQAHAQDNAQDVCVKLAGAIRGYRGEAQFTTWLYRLTYTVSIDALRANQRIVLLEPSQVSALVDGTVDNTPETDLLNAELWRAVRTLPPQQRDAVLLVYGEDRSHEEAGQILGCSEKTISWHLHEARRRLRTLLEEVT
jgi:RNA polymerase sigma-70 factor (ECF subfamily)